MTTSPPTRTRPSATRPGERRHLTATERKAALLAHVIVTSIWLGAVVVNLFLGVSAAVTNRADLADAYYVAMDRVVNQVMPAGAIATIATGLLLSLATRWGLVRHYWILAKLVLAVATVAVGVTVIDGAIQDTLAARTTTGGASASDLLLPGIMATPLMIASAATLAITKPWGRTPWSRRPSA